MAGDPAHPAGDPMVAGPGRRRPRRLAPGRQAGAPRLPATACAPDRPVRQPMTSSLPVQRWTDGALWARVARQARCADSGFDPDQWYPVSIEPARARHEAAAAIAVCASCPVRAQCLELSLRHWDIGQHGVWGGLIATDRAYLRRRWPAGRRGRRGTVVSGMIVRPPFPPVPWDRVQGGDAR